MRCFHYIIVLSIFGIYVVTSILIIIIIIIIIVIIIIRTKDKYIASDRSCIIVI